MGQSCNAGTMANPQLLHAALPNACGGQRADFEDAQDRPQVLVRKGLTIWVENVEDLVRALPFELDADLEHLHALPEMGLDPQGGPQRDTPHFPRDVGIRCEMAKDMDDNQDNYTCMQVDDLANPWGIYAVADGQGPQGHLVSTLLVHELPSLLAQNPALHRDSNLALYQSFVSVGEMASTCQFIDASVSGGTMSAILLREGLLHVSWVGDCKVVLGRLAAKPNSGAGDGDSGAGSVQYPAGKRLPVKAAGANVTPKKGSTSARGPGGRPPPLLRAVELTAEGAVKESAPNWQGVDPADGAGGPPAGAAVRFFGNSKRRAAGGANKDTTSCTPEVRRMRLKPEDVFVVLGTAGLWKRLSPSEVTTIVGQNLHRMASDAVDALVAELDRRPSAATPADDITIMVLYLAGERYVMDFDISRAVHLPGFHNTRETHDFASVVCGRGKG